MARNRTSPIEDVITIVSKLPWWVGCTLALVSYLLLHAVASRPIMPAAVSSGQMGDAVVRGFTTTLAMFGQYVLPFAFGLGAILSAVSSARQKKLYDNTMLRPGVTALNDMSWQEFEMLVSEHYRRDGFQVKREGGNGPDGGIDLVLKQKDEIYLVQCKQWKAYKVGVQPVREFYGVMAARGAAGGYFVTSGEYTADATSFAQGRNLQLIDGPKLRAMIDEAKSTNMKTTPLAKQSQAISIPACPKCGAGMARRIARQGSNAGNEFWGCVTYPKCKGVLSLQESS